MVVLQPPMIGPPRTITPPETTRRRKRSRSEEEGLQRPFEEDAFEENGTFTPAVLLLFQNGDGRWLRGRRSPASKVGTGSGVPGGAAPNHCARPRRAPRRRHRRSRRRPWCWSSWNAPVDAPLSGRLDVLARPLRRPPAGHAPRLPVPWTPRACCAGRFRGRGIVSSRAGGVRRPVGATGAASGGRHGGGDDEGNGARRRGGGCGCYSAIRPSSQTPAATRSSIVSSSRASASSSRASEAGMWTTTGCRP